MDIDDLLEGLEEEEPTSGNTGNNGDNNAMKAIRTELRKLQKQVKAQTPELEELRGYKAQIETQAKTSAAAKVFAELGLSDKQAGLFLKVNPELDPTKESVAKFAMDYGILETAQPATGADLGQSQSGG